MTALRELIEAVEAGRGWDRISGTKVMEAVGLDNVIQFRDALGGSLDAARALHEAVLPGWQWWIEPFRERAYVGVYSPPTLIIGDADNPARAWLLAVLKALEAQQ